MGVKHRGHTEPAGAPRRRFAGCSAVGRWGMRDGFRFVPAAGAPSQTQSIPSAAPAALCVALCCQNAGRGRDGGAHPVHDPWSERVHPMQGNLPRNPKESERRMVKQPQSSPWAGDKVWPHPGARKPLTWSALQVVESSACNDGRAGATRPARACRQGEPPNLNLGREAAT